MCTQSKQVRPRESFDTRDGISPIYLQIDPNGRKALCDDARRRHAICIVAYYRSPWRRLPPGPPGLPFIGSLLALKERRIWLNPTKWSKLYGGWDC